MLITFRRKSLLPIVQGLKKPFKYLWKPLKSIIRASQVVLYLFMRIETKHNRFFFAGKIFFFGYILAVILFSSCNSARRMEKGQYLLKHNAVIYPLGKVKGKGFEKKITTITRQPFANFKIPAEIGPDFILTYVKQKPNTKILGFLPLHLFIYNLVNPEKAEQKKFERDQKIDAKNKKRIEEGKTGLSEERLKAKKQRRTWREWLMGAGEPPVILDSELVKGSVKQIKLFLQSKGYQDCKVYDSVSVKGRKAKVFYIVKPGKPYKVDTVRYACEDPVMASLLHADSVNCLITAGDNFDRDAFLKERDRITHYMNDNGYYKFAKEYIHFRNDTGITSHHFNVTIDIRKYTIQDTINADSIVLVDTNHPAFHIRNVTLQMQYNPSNGIYEGEDSTKVGDYKMVFPKGEMTMRLKKILGRIFIKKGDIYRISNVDNTYTALTQLRSFRYINIKFVQVGKDALDCYIQLMPTVRHSVGIELEGTDTGGELGTQVNEVYDDKNLFKACDLFTEKFKFGFEAQKILGQSNSNSLSNAIGLNTIDIGPELDLAIPRPWFPFNLGANVDSVNRRIFHRKTSRGLWPKANPQTIFKFTYDFQNRPQDYARHIFGLAYTFNFDPEERKDLHKWNITFKLPEINYVHSTVLPSFQRTLDTLHNFFLLNSFSNHFIPDIGGGFTYNTTQIQSKKLKNSDFFKFDIEESGYLLRAFTPVLTGQLPWIINPDPGRSYSIAGVPYSYYVKGSVDYRHYFILDKDDKIAMRLYGGMGLPMAGVPQELPFDKSFWAGGANDIRGWEARTLGPGGFSQQTLVDQIGDIKLEANIEYRVSIIKILGLGFFVDAGNIWLLNPNPAVPNGSFIWTGQNAFYNQIAVAIGAGLRFDFTYFVFRFDLGLPVVDPARTHVEDWIGPKHWSLQKTVLNLGIGYPF
jgi:outer membrane protein assembly factor BamA